MEYKLQSYFCDGIFDASANECPRCGGSPAEANGVYSKYNNADDVFFFAVGGVTYRAVIEDARYIMDMVAEDD